MNCEEYPLEIELLQSLNEDDTQSQHVIDHLKQCPQCLERYHVSHKLDEMFKIELNDLPLPQFFSTKIITYIQYSVMPELKKAILEAVKSTTIHPPAHWIHQQVRPQFPEACTKSVCRHLSILKDEGDILELNFGEEFKRFDGNIEPHCHFICQNCHSIYDILHPAEKLVDLTKIQSMGDHVLDPSLELQGVCKNCQAI